MAKLSIRNLELNNKYLFVRVDFNVPLSDSGLQILDDTRIKETLPTLEYALRHHAKVIVASHLGRPKGKPNPKYSLRPVVDRLRTLSRSRAGRVGQRCLFTRLRGRRGHRTGAPTGIAAGAAAGESALPCRRRSQRPHFARQLASLCNVYVNDAFGSAHRAHASTEGITHFVSQSAAGLLLEKELNYLGKALEAPEKPFVAILGGAKVSDKIEVIHNLLSKVDALLIGGGMAYTFLKAKGQDVGKSLVEADKLDVAREALKEAEKKGVRFLLPIDHVLADKFAADAATHIFEGDGPFPAGWMALDIGPATVELFTTEIAKARTIVWNGPMGVFEMPAFARGHHRGC